MPWTTPTLTQCQERLSGPEWSALSRAAKSAEQDGEDMAQVVINNTVTRIRGRVSARPENQLGPTGTIPDELMSCFLALWVYDIISRLPGMKSLLDERRVEAWKNAESELRHVAEGKIKLVQPAAPASPELQASGSSTMQVVSSTPRRVTRSNVSGLF
jgi:hypothetical protein